MSLRPFLSFLPLFTNVLENAFSDLHIDHPALPRQYKGRRIAYRLALWLTARHKVLCSGSSTYAGIANLRNNH